MAIIAGYATYPVTSNIQNRLFKPTLAFAIQSTLNTNSRLNRLLSIESPVETTIYRLAEWSRENALGDHGSYKGGNDAR